MEQGHILQIVWGADPVVKLTLLLLLGLSVACWAIIFYKHNEIRRFRTASTRFFDAFWKSQNLEDLLQRHSGKDNPLANIFRRTLMTLIRKSKTGEVQRAPITVEGMRRQVERAVEDEIERIERYVPFLATTGSSAPFIGLFGTVWGILAAFWQIGKAGSSSLAVVGPYIAEALIATAVGLAAAIPAVIFYNFFVTRIRIFTREIQSFAEDLTQRIQRDYFQG